VAVDDRYFFSELEEIYLAGCAALITWRRVFEAADR
jgi:hypothetical protein